MQIKVYWLIFYFPFILSLILCSISVISKNQELIIYDSKSLSHQNIIAIHKNKNNIHNTFLNIESGFEIHFIFDINFSLSKKLLRNKIEKIQEF